MFVKGEPGSLSWASSAILMALDRIETTAMMGVSPDGFASTREDHVEGGGEVPTHDRRQMSQGE
jgi:hypothetical protein